MALIVEDGTGKIDAESYISVADADTYATSIGNTDWGDFLVGDKERDLRVGTQYLNLKYGIRWFGYRSNETQALDHPRTGVVDRDGYTIDSDAITAALKAATVEAAIRAHTQDLTPDISADSSAGAQVERVKVGPIEIETQYAGALALIDSFPKINKILQGGSLIGSANEVLRG